MADQDLILGKDKNGNTISYHGKKLGIKSDPDAHNKRREKDEEELRVLLRDLIEKEKNVYLSETLITHKSTGKRYIEKKKIIWNK